MNQHRPRRFRLILMAAATVGAVVLTTTLGMSGAQAGPAATPTPTRTTPSYDISPYPPSTPTNLTVVRVTSTSVTLSWTGSSSGGCCGLGGYQVWYRQAFNDVAWSQDVGTDTTVTITTNIRPTQVYTFSVVAYDNLRIHTSGNSNPVTVVTPVSDTGDTTPPPAPTDLRVTSVDTTTVGLAWTPPADVSDVVAYDVYGFDGLFISTLLGSTSGTTFQAPVSSRYLEYYVRSRDAAGNLSTYAGPAFPRMNSSSPSASVPASSSVSSVPVTQSASPPSCRVTYTVNEFPHGFVSTIVITNTGPTTVDGWTLTYTFGGDQKITNAWGGTATQSGATVTFRNASWNAAIAPGASMYVGTQGTWNASDAAPAAFALNGSACTTG